MIVVLTVSNALTKYGAIKLPGKQLDDAKAELDQAFAEFKEFVAKMGGIDGEGPRV